MQGFPAHCNETKFTIVWLTSLILIYLARCTKIRLHLWCFFSPHTALFLCISLAWLLFCLWLLPLQKSCPDAPIPFQHLPEYSMLLCFFAAMQHKTSLTLTFLLKTLSVFFFFFYFCTATLVWFWRSLWHQDAFQTPACPFRITISSERMGDLCSKGIFFSTLVWILL